MHVLLTGQTPKTDGALFGVTGSHLISPMAKDLVEKMLQKDYTKRISAAEALVHPWFKNVSQVITDPNFFK